MNTKTKYITVIIAFLLSWQTAQAQFTSRLSFGFKGGVNLSIALPQNEFSVFTSSTSPQGILKEYSEFNENLASQYHFLMYIRLGEMNYIGLLPGWHTYAYRYENQYDWTGDNNYTTRFEFKQKNSYLDIPIVFKQKFFRKRKLQPYIQIGAFYSFLQESQKKIATFETESLFSGEEIEQVTEYLPTETNFLLSNTGIMGGLGLNYRFKRAQIALETNFRYTYHNISSTANRYDNSRVLGKYYDINDDLNLMNWSFSFVYLIDLKCVTTKIPARYNNLKE